MNIATRNAIINITTNGMHRKPHLKLPSLPCLRQLAALWQVNPHWLLFQLLLSLPQSKKGPLIVRTARLIATSRGGALRFTRAVLDQISD